MSLDSVFKKIDELHEKYVNVLIDVCNIESPTPYKEGIDKCGQYFINMANALGWDVDVCRQAVSGDAVTITLNPKAEGSLVVASGHLDTVHPVGSFGEVPTRRDEVNIYGPGVSDCKGGVVAAFLAMDALHKCGFKTRPVKLILQSDEENSSITSNKETIAYMCEQSKGAAAFLNLEVIQGNTAVVQRKGILRYRFDIKGKAMHSAKCGEGANAVTEAAHKIIRLEELKDPEGLTCNCGVIGGGTVANSVAEDCFFYADIRFVTQEQLSSVKALCKEVDDTVYVPGCSCTLTEVSFRPSMPETELNMQLLDKMNEIYKDAGLPVLAPRKCLSGSDAAYITQRGIPCIDDVGIDGGRIHSINEFARTASLGESAKRIAAVAYCI